MWKWVLPPCLWLPAICLPKGTLALPEQPGSMACVNLEVSRLWLQRKGVPSTKHPDCSLGYKHVQTSEDLDFVAGVPYGVV